MTRTLLLSLLIVTVPCRAQDGRIESGGGDPWFSTFSIIAVDPATRELGVAVQSRAFAAGAAVPFAKADVGAVATQAAANRQYGPKAIALLERGLSPADVVKRITDEDPGRDTRQVAVIDMAGRSAVYTGKRVIDRNLDRQDPVHLGGFAGHVAGTNFSVQGNTLASAAVVKAMAEAYERGTGSMAERLMDALDAGQSKGGDTRGMQSAGILVVRPLAPNAESTVERVVDLRVDDATNPFVELRRLLNMTLGVPARLTEHATALARDGRLTDAIAEQKKALAITPNNERFHYALAQLYAQAGEHQSAMTSLAEAVRRQPYLKTDAAADATFAGLRTRTEFTRLVAPRPPTVPVILETEAGDVTLEIDVARAPVTANNFLQYVKDGFYDGGRFHRTVRPDTETRADVPIQVIQGGINPAKQRSAYPPIPLERTSISGLRHVDGAISMARDGADTARSDFFICIGDQPALDMGGPRNSDGQGFAAFGRVVAGMDVVKKIQAAAVREKSQTLAPPIAILRARLVER